MFHTVAFSESQNSGGNDVNVAAVPDETVTVDDDLIYIPNELTNLIGVYGLIAGTPEYAKVESPSLRTLSPLYIDPVENAADPAGEPKYQPFYANPQPLSGEEGLEAVINESGGAAVRSTVVAEIADGPLAPTGGEMFTTRATGSFATTGGEWAGGAISFDEALPVGTYQVVGADVIGSDAIAFRFVPKGMSYRPGGIATNGLNNEAKTFQRFGNKGAWFSFDTRREPQLEILTSGGSTSSEEVYLDLIKTG